MYVYVEVHCTKIEKEKEMLEEVLINKCNRKEENIIFKGKEDLI